MRLAALLTSISLAAPAAAGDFRLRFPVDCTLGESCHIQQFVDRDPGSGARDFTCGTLSYDGHKGTDIALPYLSDMQAGATVRAAADGVVLGTRNSMPDQYATDANAAEIDGKECGNGVVLRHGGGWETQYCHMKRGSVRVESGQKVKAGDVLGEVGLSGKTQFPHLHLSVRKDGAVVDPFSPDALETCGDLPGQTLWASLPPYQAGGVLGAGFSTAIPDYGSVKTGTADEAPLPPDAPAFVFWAYAFGGQAGDLLELNVTGPGGDFVSHSEALQKNQAQFYRAAGRRLRGGQWPAGSYTGVARLLRDGQEIARFQRSMTIAAQ
ncbi:M23 family metallopeptidase [Leisingera sp. ANG59]|uniref:M23 family metallopeptidase n=1 Tax=Leisingera sp. ANG59 TaxID=2675221 RepID=UPI0015749535|nr:M23 family metallopeptidase [Leisingera sp. ANG59]NSY39896.1 peptidoglycan DD-metalloendopeptidase family protein [Leisingera sp. ANG59]